MTVSKSTNLSQITPFMHVPDMSAALNWFGLIGFEIKVRHWNYAYVAREGAAVRLLESCDEAGRPHPAHRGFGYYVDVRDVAAIYAELVPKLEAAGIEYSGPTDQEYGQRELMIRAPDGNVFVFGQGIEPD